MSDLEHSRLVYLLDALDKIDYSIEYKTNEKLKEDLISIVAYKDSSLEYFNYLNKLSLSSINDLKLLVFKTRMEIL